MISKAMFMLLGLIVSFGTSADQWTVKTTTDSMTDEVKAKATVTNSNGYTLSVYRARVNIADKGSVWVNFLLPDESLDVLSGSKSIMYRIDKNPPQTVDVSNRLRSLGIVDAEVEPKWINFLIWHGQDRDGRNDAINGLMRGNSIVIRYSLFTGGYKETSFQLSNAGSGAAIASALGIGEKVDPETERAIREVHDAGVMDLKACPKALSARLKCSQKVSGCMKSAENDISHYRKCMNQ